MSDGMHLIKRSLLVALAGLSMLFITACGPTESEEAIAMYKDSDNYTMTLTITLPTYTINGEYKVDGALEYFVIEGDGIYQETTEDTTYHYTRNDAYAWEKKQVDPAFEPLIPKDTIVLDPEVLKADMFELSEDESAMILKEENYETVFGEKGPTIQSFSMVNQGDYLEIDYAFTQNGEIAPVQVTIEAIGSTEVNLPI